MEIIKSFKDLIVWQRSVELISAVYELTDQFPKSEIYGLAAQMKRAAISIASNIAEGKVRGTRKDYRHFLFTAFGSGAELEAQIEIAKTLSFGKSLSYVNIDRLLKEVMRMLNTLISKLEPNDLKPKTY